MRFLIALLVGTWPFPSSGCDRPTQDPRHVEVRDSSGIVIASNTASGWEEWITEPIPTTDIGAFEGNEGQVLARPWASLRFPDGRIAVSNHQTNEIRIYSPEGKFLRASGGEGEGPGEFRSIGGIYLSRGDTIIVADQRLLRLTLFDSTGDFARTIRLSPVEGRPPTLHGLLLDTVGVYSVVFHQTVQGKGGYARDTSAVILRPMDSESDRPVGPGYFPATERYLFVMNNGGIAEFNLPFGRDRHIAVSNELVWIGPSDRYEFRGYDPGGVLKRIVRLDRALGEPTASDKDEWFDFQTRDVEAPQLLSMYRRVREAAEPPPTAPAFSDLVTDLDGNVWVQDYEPPWGQGRSEWRVFDPMGRGVAIARLPEGLHVHEIGPDYVLGRWEEPNGVEHIRVYPLRRGEG